MLAIISEVNKDDNRHVIISYLRKNWLWINITTFKESRKNVTEHTTHTRKRTHNTYTNTHMQHTQHIHTYTEHTTHIQTEHTTHSTHIHIHTHRTHNTQGNIMLMTQGKRICLKMIWLLNKKKNLENCFKPLKQWRVCGKWKGRSFIKLKIKVVMTKWVKNGIWKMAEITRLT